MLMTRWRGWSIRSRSALTNPAGRVADLDRLDGKYQAINIKLDKAGGLTEALALAAEAKRRGLRIMVGGVISTSLGIAPALLVAQQAEIVDLDGPLRLALDRAAGAALRRQHDPSARSEILGRTWLMLKTMRIIGVADVLHNFRWINRGSACCGPEGRKVWME